MANFKLDVDGDGIALITWDMADRSMNVINTGVIEELGALVDKVAADSAIKGAVVTSGKDAFCGGADLTMLEGMGAVFANLVRTKGEEAAAAFVFDESRKAVAGLSTARDVRQAMGVRAQRYGYGRRLRVRACVPLSGRCRQPENHGSVFLK